MTGTKDSCHPETVRVAPSHQAEAEKIAAELAAIAATGMILPGSITQRRTRCGRSNCGCHADPPRLHGPYWQWTRKIAANTICPAGNASQAGRPAKPEPKSPDSVGSTRLTCGQPSGQTPLPQVSPKREDLSS